MTDQDKTFDKVYFKISQVKQANRELGHFFFRADSMHFFDSRILSKVYNGRYFITSERYGHDHPRLYTIRICNDNGSIDTMGDFQGFTTAGQAKQKLKSASDCLLNNSDFDKNLYNLLTREVN